MKLTGWKPGILQFQCMKAGLMRWLGIVWFIYKMKDIMPQFKIHELGKRRRDEKQKTLLLQLLIHYNWQHIILECRKHAWHGHLIRQWAGLMWTIKGINKLISFIKQWTLTPEVKVIGRLEMKMLKHFDQLLYLLQYAFLNT